MPITVPPISVNGATFSWGHISMSFVSSTGVPFASRGFTAVNFSESLEVAKGTVMGTNRAPTKRSLGEYSADDATVTGYQADVDAFLKVLGSQGLGSYGTPEFNLLSVFANPFETVHSVTLHRCRVIGVSSAYTAGPDLLAMDLTLSVMSISRDGMTLHNKF